MEALRAAVNARTVGLGTVRRAPYDASRLTIWSGSPRQVRGVGLPCHRGKVNLAVAGKCADDVERGSVRRVVRSGESSVDRCG